MRDGLVGVHIDDEESEDVIAHIFGPGDRFGMAAILFDGTRFIGSSALSDVLDLKIPKNARYHAAEVYPTTWRGIVILVIAGTQIAISCGRGRMIKSSTERFAATLFRLVGRQPCPCRLSIAHNQRAEICGLSRNAVAKALSVLESE